jgi:hypothetical protein
MAASRPRALLALFENKENYLIYPELYLAQVIIHQALVYDKIYQVRKALYHRQIRQRLRQNGEHIICEHEKLHEIREQNEIKVVAPSTAILPSHPRPIRPLARR